MHEHPRSHYELLRITINPPYLKPPEAPLIDLGLPIKPNYTTQDICSILKIHPDTFRYRLRRGHDPESEKVGGKRRFTIDQIKEILKTTEEMIKKIPMEIFFLISMRI